MWKVTYTLHHPTNIMTAESPLPAHMMDKVNEMRVWAMENGLLDAREEIVSPTEKRIIYLWDSKESNQAWRQRFATEIAYLETNWPAHMSESGVTHSKTAEAV